MRVARRERRKGFASASRLSSLFFGNPMVSRVRETQIIDKERDPYRHTIVDEEGTVLHDETRRLSEHQERGSAKFQKPSSDP
jgi:hypothetical protein